MKTKKTPEEISAVRRAAALKRKTFTPGPGRPKGSRNKVALANGCTLDEPRTSVEILKKSRDILAICAKVDKVSLNIFIKRLADQLRFHPRYAAAFQSRE